MIADHNHITCNHDHGIVLNARSDQYDPTRTVALRNAFARAMNRAFDELCSKIWKAIVVQDCFGLRKEKPLATFQELPSQGAFAFMTSQEKVEAFMRWLQEQVDAGILKIGYARQLGEAVYSQWTDMYIEDSYKRGVIRARYELDKAGYAVPSIEASGGIAAAMLGNFFHMDRVGLLYSRVYNDLKGITNAMDMQISRVLAQGMADGDGMQLIARKLLQVIKGTGGEMGVKDTLGRWIPAKRRAEMLTRTEIVRAHHQANIQEYRNWGVVGIYVKVEWVSAGDSRVCDRCSSLHGKIFTLDEIEGMIPAHPNCFIDPQVPVYTSEGWKPIGKIAEGDLVLTHKMRFKKVIGLPRSSGVEGETDVVTIHLNGVHKVSITKDHPVLVSKDGVVDPQWVPAKDVVEGDSIVIMANECKRCGKITPFFKKYCSRHCLSLVCAESTWGSLENRKIISDKAKKQMHREYARGTRDRFEITKKANEETRRLVASGESALQRPGVRDRVRETTNLPHHRKASSERMHDKNPMSDPLVVKRVQESLQTLYKDHPELRINSRMAKYGRAGNMTRIEQKMSDLLDKLGVVYEYQYRILLYRVDFAIPSLRIVIECDGDYWHKNKEYDELRQSRIEKEGWFVLRYTEERINNCIDEVGGELVRVLSNHSGDFNSMLYKVKKVDHWKLKKNRTLYNLSVEDDESYIANGVIVHNCRCIAIPVLSDSYENKNIGG